MLRVWMVNVISGSCGMVMCVQLVLVHLLQGWIIGIVVILESVQVFIEEVVLRMVPNCAQLPVGPSPKAN